MLSSSILTQSLHVEQHEQALGLDVFDAQGRIVQRVNAITGSSVQVGALPAGVYLFRLRTTQGPVVQRFLVE